MGEEVESLLEKGAIEQVHEDSPGFYSFLVLVPKKEGGGGQRPVINLRPLNEFIRKKPFHMMTLKEVGQAYSSWGLVDHLRPAGRISTCPGTQSVPQVPQIFMDGEKFPVSSSPQVFTRPLVERCRIKGIRVILYLDDILVLAKTETLVCQHRDYVLNLLIKVEFKLNIKKCRLTPSQAFPHIYRCTPSTDKAREA